MRHAQMLPRKPCPSCCRCAVVVGVFVPLTLSPLKPAARRRHRTRHSRGERPGTCRKPAESGVSTRPRLHPTRRINAQQSLPVIRHANWSEMPDFRPEKTKARGGVMRSRKPLWRFLRFLGPLLLVFLLLAGWGGRAPSAGSAADGAHILAIEGMGTSGRGALPPSPTTTGHSPMMPTPCPTGMGHCPHQAVAPAQLAQNGHNADERFIDMMVPHHLMAIQMAQVAERYSEHPEIKQLAAAIITTQG